MQIGGERSVVLYENNMHVWEWQERRKTQKHTDACTWHFCYGIFIMKCNMVLKQSVTRANVRGGWELNSGSQELRSCVLDRFIQLPPLMQPLV
jgi:hypothetical protein